MVEGERRKSEDVEELREVLSVVSKEVPALIKGIISSIFSEEAGREMGRAAASFYKELKEAGVPEDVAVRMTEDYISAFTSLGEVLKQAVGGKRRTESKDLKREGLTEGGSVEKEDKG
ncbi:MAG: hypothetical protein QW804_05585 [Candidatus Bathyarchaeia archaeon]|nr:hypothetical protein [Candidatus Bathyarchaeota archaeon]